MTCSTYKVRRYVLILYIYIKHASRFVPPNKAPTSGRNRWRQSLKVSAGCDAEVKEMQSPQPRHPAGVGATAPCVVALVHMLTLQHWSLAFFNAPSWSFRKTQEGWKRCKRMPTMTIQLSDSCCFGGIPRVNHLPGKKTVCWQPHIDTFSFHGMGVSSCSKCNTFLSSIRSEKLMQQQRALVEKVKSDHKVSSHWTTDFGGRNWGLVGSSDQRRPAAECQHGLANGSTQNKAIPLP